MVHVWIRYWRAGEKITSESGPVDMATAYKMIEDSHAQCIKDLNLLLSSFAMRGAHDYIIERMKQGDEYDIVDANTDDVLRTVHVSF